VVFEPTSTYSRSLELLCRSRKLRCLRLNPRARLDNPSHKNSAAICLP